MNTILNFLKSNSSAISAGAIIIGGFWALWKFREYLKDKRFKTVVSTDVRNFGAIVSLFN
jgi:hypothetical protein